MGSPAIPITPWPEPLPPRHSSGLGRPDRYPEQLSSDLHPHAAQKLYYATANFKLPDRMPTAPPTVTARIEVGAERFERKNQAFRKHLTQNPLFERVRKEPWQYADVTRCFIWRRPANRKTRNSRRICLKGV